MLFGNNLLQALPSADQTALQPWLEETQFAANHVLFEAGDRVPYCYFPRDAAAVSYFVHVEEGEAVETVIIGKEGWIAGCLSEGQHPAFARATVMHEGSFFQISYRNLRRVTQNSPTMQEAFRRYADCMLAQVFQAIACNASHTIEQRAAKWLCAAVERTKASGISMTQEQLAALMGSGRSYASRVVQRFKRDDLLQTRRGGLEVLDYEGLRERACNCNTLVREHCETLLQGISPS